MSTDVAYVVGGAALVLAAVLPGAVGRLALSPPLVLLLAGAAVGLLPQLDGHDLTPSGRQPLVLHLTEVCVVVALMGVGLALDRPLSWKSWSSWRAWGATWRLLGIAMPLTIASVALLGWWAAALAPASALLLGAVLAPTDPVLASDVQVAGPTPAGDSDDEIDERDEVRFALTSEAGLNDGLAFPFVSLAVLVAMDDEDALSLAGWLGWDLLGKTAVGIAAGTATGWLLARVAFRAKVSSLRLADAGEPLLALAAVLLAYGVAEVIGGYGFLAVFACALTLRAAERGHSYHADMHDVIERLERLLTLVVLMLLGVSLTNGALHALSWSGALVGVALVLVVRPGCGWVALRIPPSEDRVGSQRLGPRERWVTAAFGVRGVGSLYYLAYATGEVDFPATDALWSVVSFTVALSVGVHGIAATPVMQWLERTRRPARVEES